MSDVSPKLVTAPFRAKLSPPGSKSLTNRALVMAALADGDSTLSNVLLAEDTQVMLDSLSRLGWKPSLDSEKRTVRMSGSNGTVPAPAAELFCSNSGTTIRFLTALCALGRGRFVLDGTARMRQRPIAELVDLLRNMGARIEYLGEAGFPPLAVWSDTLPGGILRFNAAHSSQFLSAALMVSPYARHEVRVDLSPNQTSWPYVAMTMRLMDVFDRTPELLRDPHTQEPKQIIIPRGRYCGTDYTIEPDASNASYFLAAAAIHAKSTVTIEGLSRHSLQGDVAFADVLHRMGASLVFAQSSITVMGTGELRGIDVDLADMPDTAQTLAVTALFARGQTVMHGLHTLRIKETDRLAALSNELSKLGAMVDIEDDTLAIDPPRQIRPAAIDTYNDHRMAMSFALAATKSPGVVIKDAQCVNKTYPEYFDDLARVLAGT